MKSARLVAMLLILFSYDHSSAQSLQGNNNSSKKNPFTFVLTNNATTSAGVYRSDSTLLRTLWSGVKYKSGTHKENWDGKDDDGNLSTDTGYFIRVLSANVGYKWEGARIGNTSDALTGDTRHRLYEPIRNMAITGTTAYVVGGYNEAFPAQYKFDTRTPQKKQWIGALNGTEAAIDFVCTDGVNAYWSGTDPLDPKDYGQYESFVFATKCSDDSQTDFGANGSPASMAEGHTYFSAISHITTSTYGSQDAGAIPHLITGLAVQQRGRYLFVSRAVINSLKVYDKITGKLVQDLKVNNAGRTCIDGDDNLWLKHGEVLEKFNVNSDGTLSASGLAIDNRNVEAFTLSPNNTMVLTTDVNTQQVKAYDNSKGSLLWTLGEAGGYLQDATVTNAKFAFKDITDFHYFTYLAFQPDGSFWVGDAGNCRVQHFAADRSFIETLMFIPNTYSVTLDQNNSKRVFANYFEFEVDYSKPLDNGKNGSWKFVRNWAVGFDSKQFGGSYDPTERLRKVTTLSNGRTYGILRSTRVGPGGYPLVEFIDGGIVRNTGIDMGPRGILDKDGSFVVCSGSGYIIGQQSVFSTAPLKGFDAQNNPVWGEAVELLRTPVITSKDPMPWENSRTNPIATNHAIFFDYNRFESGHGDGYHLGAIKKGDNKWLWKTAQSTFPAYEGPFPTDGTFDIGNGTTYPGGTALMQGDNIFWNFKGEFYKQSQTNKWNQVDINTGLFIGQFGVVGAEIAGREEAPAEMAGNVFTGAITEVDGVVYIYHNDEGVHNGVHRWRITGLNTIAIQTAALAQTDADTLGGVDLMVDLPKGGGTLLNNTAGWTRDSKTDITTDMETNYWVVRSGLQSYDRFKTGDVHVVYRQKAGVKTVVRDLENSSTLKSWKLEGKINFEGNTPTQVQYKGGSFLELLDDKNRIITRFDIRQDKVSGANAVGNDKIILHFSETNAQYLMRRTLPLSISAEAGVITFTYGSNTQSTTTKVDASAKWDKPATMRMYFWTNEVTDNYYRVMDISEMRFIKNEEGKSKPGHYFRSKANGKWNTALTWQSSEDSVSWMDATLVPDTAATAINILSSHIVTITATETVNRLTINNGGTLQVAPNAAVIVNDAAGDDITIAASGKMVILSDATGTGRIGESTGTITGDVTVERYLPGKPLAAYRMLAPSVNTATSIRDNWQEGTSNATVLINNDPVPGYGTHITGSLLGLNGFDASPARVSLLTFNQALPAQGWAGINNTNVNRFDATKGYLLLTSGNRSVDIQSNAPQTKSTTLRATGTVLSGDVDFTALEGNGRNSVIANPYASPISWVALQAANSSRFENYYTVWDPNVGARGGYVTVDATGTTSVRNSEATTEIPTGQAFMIKAKQGITAPGFKISEAQKSAIGNVNMFRTAGEPVAKLYTSLYYKDENGVRSMADGMLSRFDDSYVKEVDGDDAGDIANFDENIALERSGKLLSIESRPVASNNDTLFFNISNMRQQAYEWQFDVTDFDQAMTTHAFFKDRYLGTEIPIELDGQTVINFTITADAKSIDPNRFVIVFEKLKTLPVTLFALKAYEQNTGVAVEWKTATELSMDKYEVERSTNGQVFTTIGATPAKGTNTSINEYKWNDGSPATGYNYYRIRSISKDGSAQYSTVIRVFTGNAKAALNIFPNPVKDGNLSVQLGNLQKGTYMLSLFNVSGQAMVSKRIEHPGGAFAQTINTANLARGMYQLQVAGDNFKQTQQIVRL